MTWRLQRAWALCTVLAGSATSKRADDEEEQLLNYTPSKFSRHRKSCLAQEDLDSKYFPPELFGNESVRIAAAGIPGIGDLHLSLETLQVMKASFRAVVQRKTDDSFSFEIGGIDDEANGKARLWFDGLRFQLPQSTLDTHARTIAGIENFFGGWAKKNYGRIDRGPVSVDFRMSADFVLQEDRTWALVVGTQKQKVSISVGNGGVLMTLINLGIKVAGGIDTLFFNAVWPTVQQLIPEALGRAFSEVPYEEGELAQEVSVFAVCPDPAPDGRACKTDELDVDVKVSVTAKGRPQPILRKLQEWKDVEGPMSDALTNLLAAYDRGEHNLLDGWRSTLAATAKLKKKKDVKITVEPDAMLPLHFLKAVLPNITLYDFIPETGALEGNGKLHCGAGKCDISRLSVSGVTLPINDKFATISTVLKDVELELEGDEEVGDELLLFGKDAPLSLKVNNFLLKVGSGDDGLIVRAPGTKGTLSADYVKKQLKGLRSILRQPVNVRNASKRLADGVVPQEFRRPPARMPAHLELKDILRTATVTVEASATTLREDLFELKAQVEVDGRLKLGAPFWRAVTDNKDPDWGYLQLTLLGFMGTVKKNRLPKTESILRLVCGVVQVYEATESPFDISPKIEVSLTTEGHAKRLQQVISIDDDYQCVVAKVNMWNDDSFCTTKARMDRLQKALRIQVERLEDAVERWEESCYRSADDKEDVCDAKPDGTWFIPVHMNRNWTQQPEYKPPKKKKVKSPWQLWLDALSGKDWQG